VSTTEILILGVIAGGTIFLGLPIGRLQNVGPAMRAGLSAFATGILVFLLWDVLAGAVGPIEEGVEEHDWAEFAGFAALGLVGFVLGYMTLVYYAEWMKRKGNSRPTNLVGPGAAAIDEFEGRGRIARLTPGRQLALLIAVGIGVHNFGEGLAIGQAAANELTALAVTLVVGFALHNATEGFGIVGPMAGEGARPSWRFLGLLGLIGGGPTFVGTLIGQAWTSTEVSVLFFAIAAGSILYVVQELFAANRRYGHAVLVAWLVFLGIVVGFGTDFVIEAAGV
jgi:zinc transporter, ZIP family